MAEDLLPGEAAADINTAGVSTTTAMAYLNDEKADADMVPALNLGDLDITTDEFILDEVDIHIQANLEDELVKEALKTGVDLRQYSKQVEAELQRIEQASIKDLNLQSLTTSCPDIKESQNIASLHNQITACDSILERMEEMLSGFQSDLSSISSEIQTLAVCKDGQAEKPRPCPVRLSQLLDELLVLQLVILGSISGNAVYREAERVILDSPVTEQEFLEQLHELNNKINFAKELSFRETLACSDIQDIVDRLKIKAVTKIREFILQKIYSFRKPMTNYQIPQNTLLKYRFLYQCVLVNVRTVCKVCGVCTWTSMSMSTYSTCMSVQQPTAQSAGEGYTECVRVRYEDVADKDDLMGVEDTAKKDILYCFVFYLLGLVLNLGAGFFSKPSLKSRNTIFTLGQRGAVLSPAELEGPILIPHAAQRGDCRVSTRHQHHPCLSAGYFLFLSGVLSSVSSSSSFGLSLSRLFVALSLSLKNMSTYVSDCYDSIAIFLCIHIILRFKAITAKRNIPALDKCVTSSLTHTYWEAVAETDRYGRGLSSFLEMNIQSIRNTPDPSGRILRKWNANANENICNPKTLRQSLVKITRRYAEFSSAIVSINQTFPNERTNALLGQLQIEVENFVLKMAAEFPSRKDQLIFLINNYDMMLGVLMERAADDSKEVEGFQQLLLARTQEFIEEILAPPFGGMITFVKESEALMEKGQLDKLKNDEVRITQLVRGFSSTWKQSVEALSQDVMRSFTNFKNGTSIIQ
ncbi:hypothetical protein NFI96_013739, partial [Prochilodus magdalenae]